MINYTPPIQESYSDALLRYYPTEHRHTFNITFQVTEDCCMACTYCYQHDKTIIKMNKSTAKDIIDKLLNNEIELITTNNVFAIIIDFIGGEPLLEIELIEFICHYMITKMIQCQHPWLPLIRFSICSNGLLYNTPDVQKFFKKYADFLSFSISLDGCKELHDSCRLDLNGNGTYDRILESVYLHRKHYKNLNNTKMTFSPDNIYYVKDALINLIKENYTMISCNCVFESGWDEHHATILYYQLKEVADYLIENDLYNKIYIRIFNENNYAPLNETDNNNWCGGTDMKCVAFDCEGNMYPCIRYMKSSLNGHQKPLQVGNINTGYLSTEEEKNNFCLVSNITRRSQSTDECFYCPIAAGCSWCSGYNYEEFGTPNKRATYICCMHKAESLANVYYWNKLYKYLNIDKVFTMHLDKNEALKIINNQEYNYLLSLTKREE